MKNNITKSIVWLVVALIVSCAEDPKQASTLQEKHSEEKPLVKKDTIKQMNLLDKQTEIFGSVFGMAKGEGENPFKGTTNYLQLIEKMDMHEVQKQEFREIYKLYDLSLDPRKKDSVKLLFNKKFKDAMAKSASNPD